MNPMQRTIQKTKRSKVPGIVIFDIDQTLVHAFAIHNQATSATLRSVFGISGSLLDIDYEGRTIKVNLFNILKKHGVKQRVITSLLQKAIKIYDKEFDKALKCSRKQLLIPGAKDAVIAAKQAGNILCVVTGGTPHVAKKLLITVGLASYFDVFVFGTESNDRAKLLRHAISKARKIAGYQILRKHIISVGDSIHDITAAQANKIRIITVCTGSTRYTRLKKACPDYIVKNLMDPCIPALIGGWL